MMKSNVSIAIRGLNRSDTTFHYGWWTGEGFVVYIDVLRDAESNYYLVRKEGRFEGEPIAVIHGDRPLEIASGGSLYFDQSYAQRGFHLDHRVLRDWQDKRRANEIKYYDQIFTDLEMPKEGLVPLD